MVQGSALELYGLFRQFWGEGAGEALETIAVAKTPRNCVI